MDEAQIKALYEEALDLKASILVDFPELEEEMAATVKGVYIVTGDCSVKDIIYRSLLAGATMMYKKQRDAQRAAEEAIASARNKT